jgi:hypothetical protein
VGWRCRGRRRTVGFGKEKTEVINYVNVLIAGYLPIFMASLCVVITVVVCFIFLYTHLGLYQLGTLLICSLFKPMVFLKINSLYHTEKSLFCAATFCLIILY